MYLASALTVLLVLIAVATRTNIRRLDPRLVFLVALTYALYADYLVRAEDAEVTSQLTSTDITWHSLTILVAYIAIAVLVINDRGSPLDPISTLRMPSALGFRVSLSVLCICADVVKRLYVYNWQIGDAIVASFGPRGKNLWSSQSTALGDSTFILSLTLFLVPLAGMLAVDILLGRSNLRYSLISTVTLVLSLLLLLSYGSRTFFAIPIGYGVVKYLLAERELLRSLLAATLAALFTVAAFSVLFLYRSDGIIRSDGSVSEAASFELTYHQDDNFFRVLHVLHVATSTSQRLDPAQFFFATAVNPIPRFFWADKPALLDNYYGDFKPSYITITFIGEAFAMFGPSFGVLFATVVGYMLYRMLKRAHTLLEWDFGLGLYLLASLYIYMCMRSLLNLTQWSYFLASGLIISRLLTTVGRCSKNR